VETLLEQLGLSKVEARVYLCLLEQSPLPAATIADLTKTSRSSVYLVLRSLVDKGLIDAGAGYSSRYRAAPPERALAGLLERDRAEPRSREWHIEQALPELTKLYENSCTEAGEIVEILRTPKQARRYPGELPMKFAVFDTQAVIMPLVSPGVSGVVAVIVRNRALAATLELLFNTLWESSEPLGHSAP
jgi:predicted DNA-binding transcriptional regulator